MEEKCCAFIGHRPERFPFRYKEQALLCMKIKAILSEQAEEVYRNVIRQYWFGGSLGVELWAAEEILKLRKRYPDITLSCALPFPDFDVPWRAESRKRFAKILSYCDEVVTICGE